MCPPEQKQTNLFVYVPHQASKKGLTETERRTPGSRQRRTSSLFFLRHGSDASFCSPQRCIIWMKVVEKEKEVRGRGGEKKVKARRGMTDMGEKKVENWSRAKRGEAHCHSCCLCSYESVTYSLLAATRSLGLWHIYTHFCQRAFRAVPSVLSGTWRQEHKHVTESNTSTFSHAHAYTDAHEAERAAWSSESLCIPPAH